MSDKMRQYMPVMAFWILVILSAFHFSLAAPVAVREILEVRSNAVGILNDGITAWEKRMDSGDEGQWSTNEQASSAVKPGSSALNWYPPKDYWGKAFAHAGEGPGYDEDVLGTSPGDKEEMVSNGRWPDPNPDGEHDGGKEKGNNPGSVKGKGGYISDDNSSGPVKGNDGHIPESGYDGDYDSDGEQGSHNPGPQPEHPASPKSESDPLALFLEDLLDGDLFEGSPRLRPRNSDSGAVYAKEGVAGNC